MKLHEAQKKIINLSNPGQKDCGGWAAKAVRLATALLPVLAWPDGVSTR